jgi:diguanylate cyclase (GGDEF)-like protein
MSEVLSQQAPIGEAARLATLRSLNILDSDAEERFDRITRLAARLFDVPMAAVSLIDEDRQWFKSRIGIDDPQTPRSDSFCAHAIAQPDPVMHVYDATQDHRFAENPFVTDAPNVRFYAGAPIAAPDGSRLGALCVIGDQPRGISADDAHLLRELAGMVEQEIATAREALVDELTGLTNRRGFVAVAQRVLALCNDRHLPAAVVFADVDGLKPINDQLGHEAGDRAIREVADLLATSFRTSDVVARLGGDEFAVFFAGTADVDEPLHRLRQGLIHRNVCGEAEFRLGVSTGVATFDPAAPVPLDVLLATADAEMYRRKKSHKA